MNSNLSWVVGNLGTPAGLGEAAVAMGFSLVAALAAYLMYRLFYGSRNIGAGVDRSFIIGGPAITALFLGIQTSIPLSLGLLGALSFVRFRTPVKDPAEIGFLLLLIASSIGAATGNYLLTTLLFVLVFAALGVQWLLRNRFRLSPPASLMIALSERAFAELQEGLESFLRERLSDVELQTVSVREGRVTLQYRYRAPRSLDRTAFTRELSTLAAGATADAHLEAFLG